MMNSQAQNASQSDAKNGRLRTRREARTDTPKVNALRMAKVTLPLEAETKTPSERESLPTERLTVLEMTMAWELGMQANAVFIKEHIRSKRARKYEICP